VGETLPIKKNEMTINQVLDNLYENYHIDEISNSQDLAMLVEWLRHNKSEYGGKAIIVINSHKISELIERYVI
jgi:hypothetical protein